MRRLVLLLSGLGVIVLLVWLLLAHSPLHAAPPVPVEAHPCPRPAWHSPVAQILRAVERDPDDHLVRAARSAAAATPPLSATTNYLIAGLDTRPERYGGRTDALVVLVVDERSDHVGLVSVPRDLWVSVPGAEDNRINTVYNTGVREGGAERGAALLRQVVKDTLGLPIARLVFVDHAGFEGLVDELEGVSVLVRCPIRDRFLDPRGSGGRLELRLEAGVRQLDGRTALMYARSRHGRGVFDRALRQQAILLGLRDRLLELGPARLAHVLPALQKTVYTDLSTLELLRLARRLRQVKREHLHGLVLGGKHAEPTTLEDGRWVMLPKPDEIHGALSHLFAAPPPGRHPSAKAACPEMDAALQ